MIRGEDDTSLSQQIYNSGIALRHLSHREGIPLIECCHPLSRLSRLTFSHTLNAIRSYDRESLYTYVLYHNRREHDVSRLSESFEYHLRDEEKDPSFYTGRPRKDTIIKERRILS